MNFWRSAAVRLISSFAFSGHNSTIVGYVELSDRFRRVWPFGACSRLKGLYLYWTSSISLNAFGIRKTPSLLKLNFRSIKFSGNQIKVKSLIIKFLLMITYLKHSFSNNFDIGQTSTSSFVQVSRSYDRFIISSKLQIKKMQRRFLKQTFDNSFERLIVQMPVLLK